MREILPTLFNLLLGHLASNSYDKRQVAARTLGDLVKKLGERVLPEIIPILEKGLESEHSEKRQGVCVGLSEIMTSTSREMVLSFADSLVPTVRKALCDELPEVINSLNIYIFREFLKLRTCIFFSRSVPRPPRRSTVYTTRWGCTPSTISCLRC